jgi:hypothetical protein
VAAETIPRSWLIFRPPVPPHEHQRPAWPHLAGGVARDLERQHHMLAEPPARLICVHLEERPVMRAASVTITWSIGSGIPSKKRFSDAGSFASKAAVLWRRG